MEEIKISIIIPVYNVGNALIKCVESIKNQPYDDYEVILIDDGSTDTVTKDLLEKYENEGGKIVVFHKPNGGCFDARKYGLMKANGEFVSYGDSDDFFSENCIELMHKAIDHPADLYLMNNYLNKPGTEEFYIEKELTTGYSDMNWFMDQMLHVRINAVWDKIYKRALLEKAMDKLKENIIFGDDTYINNGYLRYVNSVYIMNETTYFHYVDSSTSVCGRKVKPELLKEISIVFDSLSFISDIEGVTKKGCNAYRDFYYGCYARAIASLLNQGFEKKDINILTQKNDIMKKIFIFEATSLKGFVYRIILKFKLYRMAELIYR